MKKGLLSFIFLCISPLSLLAQSMGYIHYGISENLLSSQVYELMEDDKGYIWALTDKGIHRFNGANFEEIPIEESLSQNLPIDLLEDDSGTIWFLFLDGSLGSYNSLVDTIQPHAMNAEIQKICSTSRFTRAPLNNSLHMTNDGGLIYSFYYLGLILVYPDSVQRVDNQFDCHLNVLKVKGVDIVCHSKNISKNRLRFNLFGHINKLTIDNETSTISGGTNVFFQNESSEGFLVDGNILMRVEEDGLAAYTVFESVVLAVRELKKGELTVFFDGKRPVVVDIKSLKKLRETTFPFEFVTYCIKDKEGGVWYSTLYNGILYIPPVAFSKYDLTTDKQISALKLWDNKLYYGTLNGEIGYIEDKQIYTIVPPNIEKEISDFFVLHDELYVLTNHVMLKLEDGQVVNRFPEMDYKLSAKDICLIDDTLFMARNNGLQFIFNSELYYNNQKIINQNNQYVRLEKLNYQLRISSICEWNGQLYGAIGNTIQKLNNKNQAFDTVFVSTSKIRSIRANTYGFFYLTNEGVYWINKLKDKHQCILASPNFGINEIYLNQNALWIAGMKGIYKTELNSTTFSFDLSHLELCRSTENIDFRVIEPSKEKLYVGSSQGIFEVAHKELGKRSNEINMYLNRVENNGKKVDLLDEGNFSHDQNGMIFYLDVLKNSNRSDIMIEYRLSTSSEWETTTQLKIEFPFLAPNEYHFQARACIDGKYSETREYQFVIVASFWERSSTKIGAVIAFFLFILWYFQRRIIKMRREQETEHKIAVLEKQAKRLHQQALSAQMNPHFMFNALSSIQTFILENDTAASEKYLTDFGHLMRLILESSIDEFIEIDKEIKLLRAYLNLEQLRHEFSFQFHIDCASELLDEGFKIPAMILQPIVENAVEHGINGSDSGKIEVVFQDKETYVECRVIDNGNMNSPEEKSFHGIHYKSRATHILTDRITILKADYPKTLFENVKSNETNNPGTIIKITLPLIG